MEKDKWSGHTPTHTAVQNLQVRGHGSWGSVQIHWKCIRFFGISPRTTRDGCIFLKTVRAGDEFSKFGKRLCLGVARCVGDLSASGMVWTGADGSFCGVEWSRLASKAGLRPRKWAAEREGLRARGLASTCCTFSLYQTRLDRVWMSSWYSAGCGWLVTDGSVYGRRSGDLGYIDPRTNGFA